MSREKIEGSMIDDRMTCKNCCHFTGGENHVGECRRRAPSSGANWGEWPKVHSTDWCGEHAIDTTKFDAITGKPL